MKRIIWVVFFLICLPFIPRPIHAAIFTVNSTADTDDGNCDISNCTLREAVNAANAVNDSDTLIIPDGTYSLTSGTLFLSTDMILQGTGENTTILSGNPSTSVVEVNSSAIVNISRLSLVNGLQGIAISSSTVTLDRCLISNNATSGIFIIFSTLSVEESTLSMNGWTSPSVGGGIHSGGSTIQIQHSRLLNNHADLGGAVHNDATDNYTLSNSTISGNTAGEGGGIRNFGNLALQGSTFSENVPEALANYGTASIQNSTISNNTNTAGIWNLDGTINVQNSTFSLNDAFAIINYGGSFSLQNTVVAGNSQDCLTYAPISSGGYNLIGNNTGCDFTGTTGDQVGTASNPIDPKLGPLANNGGLTWTHALLAGSPALNAGGPTTCLDEDQRGFLRSLPCDIGAFEVLCGDGVLQAFEGEACDDGNTENGDGCDSNCTATACGNGIMTTGEACDDGNSIDGDACDSNCSLSACGNGIQDASEACDDENSIDGDGCDSNCTTTDRGNGIQTTGEDCDDGNFVDGDGCDSNFTVTACGNSVLTNGEECDDGNLADGDACDHECRQEINEIREDFLLIGGGGGCSLHASSSFPFFFVFAPLMAVFLIGGSRFKR